MASILHPTDLGPGSHSAFLHALWLASRGGHDLTLLHTSDGDAGGAIWSQFPHVRDQLAAWGIIEPGLSTEQLKQQTGIRIKKVEMGTRDAVPSILAYLEHHPTHLIVAGTEGRTGLDAWLRPSVAQGLLANIHQPLMLVRQGIDGFANAQSGPTAPLTVLVPVDRQPDPQVAVDFAMILPDLWHLPVDTVHALHAGDTPLTPPIQFRDMEDVRTETLTVCGDPETVILDHCRKTAPDLAVLTRSGPTGISETFLGSTSNRLIPQLPCPVVVIPEPSYD